MEIVQIFNEFFPSTGGIQTDMYEQSRRLVKRGHKVTILTSNVVGGIKGGTPMQLSDKKAIDGIVIKRFKVSISLPHYNFYITPSVISELFSIKADIIHVFSYLPVFLTNIGCIISKIRNIPLVMTPTYYPSRSLIYNDLAGKLTESIYDKFIGLKLLKKANSVIALTEVEARYYQKRGIENVYVNPIGINQEEEKIRTEDIEAFKMKYNLGNRILLSVGRIERRKGVEFLFKAMPFILENFPETELLLVGDNLRKYPYLEKIAKQLGISNSVISTGRVITEDILSAYEAADVVVVPSLFEAFSRVVIEAWIHKKPVVASKNIGLAESISSENGILVDYGDHKALAEAIIMILQNRSLAESMGCKGHQLVKEKFNWDEIVDKLEEVYYSVLGAI